MRAALQLRQSQRPRPAGSGIPWQICTASQCPSGVLLGVEALAHSCLDLIDQRPGRSAEFLAESYRLTLRGHNERQRFAAMFAKDREMRIQGADVVPIEQFRHPNNAGIGERHRRIPVLFAEPAHSLEMIVQLKSDLQRAVFQQAQQRILCGRQWGEQKHGLRQDRLTYQQRCVEITHLINRPSVMPVASIQIRQQRSGINDCRSSHVQTLPCVLGWSPSH